MRPHILCLVLAVSGSLALTGCKKAAGPPGLHLTYGTNGIEQLSYNGVVLENLAQNPSDAFHIWHMKASDVKGQVLKDGQYGWGENNTSRNWNPVTHTWTYQFTWGSIAVQFAQSSNTLSMNVTETNKASSGITFDGATIYPFVLRFPDLPAGFNDPSFAQIALTTAGNSGPMTADFGQGQVVCSVRDRLKPLYYGFEPAGGGPNYFPIISSTAMDSLAPSFQHVDRPIAPGQTESFTVELHFTASPNNGQ